MKHLFFMAVCLCLGLNSIAQAPQGFSYQAIVRNTQGEPLAEQAVSIQLTIQNEDGTVTHYAETHAVTTSPQGLVSMNVGSGDPTAGTFADIPWVDGSVFLKLEVDPAGGTSYSPIGTTQLLAVPYALHAQSAREVIAPPNLAEDEPLFVVHNNAGQIVFAVYQTGVRIYVEDEGVKSTRGGFAIGGLSDQTKEDGVEYLRVTPDSVRFNINTPNNGVKPTRGGFAVGGLSDQTKGTSTDLLFIAPDSARIYVRTTTAKQTRGGFAIGGLSDQTKSTPSNFLYLTPENYFIGHNSGYAITTGLYNSALGYESGMNITEGFSNSFVGYQSGYLNNTGTGNLFLGYQTGYSNQHGNYNTFLGYMAGYMNYQGINNTFLGSFSGKSNIDGSFNTFIGDSTGYANTYGFSNTFIGTSSGVSNTTGESNVLIGTRAGYTNSWGSKNVFIGHNSGYSNISGGANVCIGTDAGYNSISTWNNVLFGTRAGLKNADGQGNVMIGYESGMNNIHGDNNIFLGAGAGLNETGSNKLYIGYGDSTLAMVWGDMDTRQMRFNSRIGINTTPEYHTLSIFDHMKDASISLEGVGTETVFSSVNLNTNQWSADIGYSIQCRRDRSFGIMLRDGDQYLPRFEMDIEGRIGINSSPDMANVTVFEDIGPAHMILKGVGNEYDYAMISLFNSLAIDTLGFQLSYMTDDAFVIAYKSASGSRARMKISNNGNVMLNSWEHATEVLDVNGNARFRAVGTAAGGVDLLITPDGVLTTSASDLRLKENFLPLTNSLEKVLNLKGLTFSWKDTENGQRDAGLIAQEVLKVFPEAVFVNPKDGYYGINYSRFPALFVEAIKEQQEIIDNLNKRINELEEKNQELELLKTEIESIKSILSK